MAPRVNKIENTQRSKIGFWREKKIKDETEKKKWTDREVVIIEYNDIIQ